MLRDPITPVVTVVIGLVLLLVEALRVINGHSLTGINAVLLWVGLGIIVIGAALLILTVASAERADRAAATTPEPPEASAHEPGAESAADPAPDEIAAEDTPVNSD